MKVSKVKIGSVNYKVKKVDDLKKVPGGDKDCFGLMDGQTQTIYINSQLPKGTFLETLMHEVMHAIWLQSGLYALELDEEVLVAIVSPWITAFIKDNPNLIKEAFNV